MRTYTKMKHNHNITSKNTRQWKGRSENSEDMAELHKLTKQIKDKIKIGFKNDDNLQDIEKSLNTSIDVSIVLARRFDTKHVIRTLLNAIRILLNKPEMTDDDLLQ